MEDRYLFRGKRIDNGEWIIGYLWQNKGYYISNDIHDLIEIDPATIGQCTGLKDKNKKLFFTDDECLSDCEDEIDILYIVRWNKTYAYFYFEIIDRVTREHIDAQPFSDWESIEHFEIIGNIHDTKTK